MAICWILLFFARLSRMWRSTNLAQHEPKWPCWLVDIEEEQEGGGVWGGGFCGLN